MAIDGIYVDAVAESGRNSANKHQFRPECEEWAAWRGTGQPYLSRETEFSGTNGDREYPFPLFRWPQAGLATVLGWSVFCWKCRPYNILLLRRFIDSTNINNFLYHHVCVCVRYVVCWTEIDGQRNIYEAPTRACKQKQGKNDKKRGNTQLRDVFYCLVLGEQHMGHSWEVFFPRPTDCDLMWRGLQSHFKEKSERT